MPRLQGLISESLHVIREARVRYRRLAVLWSMGKDWDVERPHADRAGPVERPRRRGATARRNRAVKRQPPGRLLPVRPRALQGPWTGRGSRPSCCPAGRLTCCQALKTEALRQAVAELGLEAVLLGIRRDEHGVRAKERTFSPRTATQAAGLG
jgi:sulfate adenylyltransferase subunit 2